MNDYGQRLNYERPTSISEMNARQQAIGFFCQTSSCEIPVELQQRCVQEYCRAMDYDLFSEITSEQPFTEAQAHAICGVLRNDMKMDAPIKLIVQDLQRISHNIRTVHRISEIFTKYDITLESVSESDQEILGLNEYDEYEFFEALSFTGLTGQ